MKPVRAPGSQVDLFVSILDIATLEVSVSLHGFSHPATSPSASDFSHSDSTSSLQTSQHLDFSTFLPGLSRLAPSPSALAAVHPGPSAPAHSFARVGPLMSPFDAQHLGASSSARAFVCSGSLVSFYGAVSLDPWNGRSTGTGWYGTPFPWVSESYSLLNWLDVEVSPLVETEQNRRMMLLEIYWSMGYDPCFIDLAGVPK